MLTGLLPVLAVILVVVFARHRDPASRARGLRRAGLGWVLVYGLFFGAFVAGETVVDPGGWAAVGLIAAWALPLAVLSWLAWRRPGWALPPIGAVLAVALVFSVWAMTDWDAYRAFQDRNGPVDAVVLFVASIALGLLGYRHPSPAAVLLLVAAAVPALAALIGSGAPLGSFLGGSVSAATAPGVVTGVLYLVAERVGSLPADGRQQPPVEHDAV